MIAAILALESGARADGPRVDPVDDVRRLEAALEYERALVLADQLIASGRSTAHELVELHFEAGKLAAGLDHADAAQDHFARALALEPTLALPAGTSPKLADPLAAARASSRPLAVASRRAEGRITVTADDPAHFIATVRVHITDEAGRQQDLVTRDGPPFVIVLPPGVRDTELAVLDDHGNELFHASERAPRAESRAAATPAWYGRWSTWGIAAGVTLAAGGFSAWRLSVAQSDWNQLRIDPAAHDYSQLRAIEDRGRSWALAANIGFGVAGAAAIAAVITWRAGARESDLITVTASPGSVGVAGRF